MTSDIIMRYCIYSALYNNYNERKIVLIDNRNMEMRSQCKKYPNKRKKIIMLQVYIATENEQ